MHDVFQKSTAKKALDAYFPEYQSEKDALKSMKKFLSENANFAYRTNLEGHFTGSAWVVSPDFSEALLIHHIKLNKWLQPGGHLEYGDASFLDGAKREAREEMGIDGFQVVSDAIFDIDIHTIPEKNHEPEHLHYDVRYILSLDNTDISKLTLWKFMEQNG